MGCCVRVSQLGWVFILFLGPVRTEGQAMSVGMRVLGQGIGILESWGRGEKEVLTGGSLGHRMWAGARPPACHPHFPHGEGRKLPSLGPLAGGWEQGGAGV